LKLAASADVGKRCCDPTFFAWGEQANVGAQGAPTYVDFRAYAYVEAGAGRAAAISILP
jgi:hypothetical protein